MSNKTNQDAIDDFLLLMRSKKKKEAEAKRVATLKEQEPRLIEELTKMDTEWSAAHDKPKIDYDELFEPSLGLEHKEYDKTSEDEMRKWAEDKYAIEYDRDKKKLDERYGKKKADTESDIDDIYNNESVDLRDLKDKYAEKKRRAKNQSQDNGIAKSSIARLVDSEVALDEKDDMTRLHDDTITKVAKKKNALDALIKERDSALANLDVKKAHDISREIEKYRDEQERNNKGIDAFNESVDRREVEYQLKRQNAIDKIRDRENNREKQDILFEKRYGYRPAKAENYRSRLNKAMEFYNQMPRDVAIESITGNGELKKLLGKYYNDLLARQKVRRKYDGR